MTTSLIIFDMALFTGFAGLANSPKYYKNHHDTWLKTGPVNPNLMEYYWWSYKCGRIILSSKLLIVKETKYSDIKFQIINTSQRINSLRDYLGNACNFVTFYQIITWYS